MAVQKVYSIQINGLTESIKAVDALNASLDALEKKIKALEDKSVSVGAKSSGGGSKSSSTSSLSEEAKLEKQIEQLEEKRIAHSKQIYQNYLAAKDVLKETEKDQKSIAATERLQANTYSNTIAGMKQELADIKSVMQTVDLGDTDQFDKMTQRAKELNDKLKEIEQSYGQFGRNVGNYKESLNGITVTIGGVTREFDNSKKALRSLKQELDSLSASEKGNSNYAKELRREYNKLKSAIDDATKSSKFMDEALDTMQSFTALNQISHGFSTFFGIDNSEMEKQIARLVALQNALQGLEKINKQIDSEEGIGKWLAKGSRGIDTFITRITGAEKRMGLFIGKTREASVRINAFAKALKGVGAVGVAGGMMFLTSVVGNFIEKLSGMLKRENNVGDASKYLESTLKTLTNTVDRLQNENLSAWFNNLSTDVGYLKNNLELLSRSLVDVLSEIDEAQSLEEFEISGIGEKIDIKNIKDAKKAYKELLDELSKLQKPGLSLEKLFASENSIKEAISSVGDAIVENFLYRAKQVSEEARNEILKTGKVSEETAEKVKDLNREINEDFVTNSALANVADFSSKGSYYASQVDFVTQALKKLNETVNAETLSPDYIAQLKVDSMQKGRNKTIAQNDLNRKREIEQANGNLEAIALINKKYDNELKESLKSINQQYSSALNDLNRLRIEAMRDGLKKQLAQLNQEKREKIQAIVADGILVGERTLAVNRLYDKKILEAKRDWAAQIKKVYQDLYSQIESINKQTFGTETQNAQTNVENRRNEQRNSLWSDVGGTTENTTNLNKRKAYYEQVLEIETKAVEKLNTIHEEEISKLLDYNKEQEKLRHENVVDAKTTSLVLEELAKYEEEKGIPLMPDAEDFDWEGSEKKLQGELAKLKGELVDAYNSGELDFKQFVSLIQKEQDAHNANMNSLEKEYAAQSKKNLQDSLNERKALVNSYYQDVLSAMRQRQDEISATMGITPIINNDWGVVEISKTKRAYKQAEADYKEFAKNLVEIKKQLKKDLNDKKITAEDYFMRLQELEALIKSIKESLKQVETSQKNLAADFLQSIQMYIQAGVESFNTIMNAVWDAQGVQFDKEQEALEKENEMLQEKLNKQQEMIEEHKNKVDSIEDELANSRGDRRQHLIDQLNAEMEAQKRAEKEKEKLQKQEEANKKKQEKLDKKRKEAEYNRQILQAIVNGAMAVTMAAINTWPIPAIPMMALAGATTAAQVAIMKANKPYARGGQLDGGVAVGNRHRDGGIKVLGGHAEIEGGEFITNRLTTEKNIDLLEFVNSKKKRIDVNDLLEFYSSGSVKKNIMKMSPKTKFADGGYIPPTLSNNIDLDDRLMSAFENYSNRPVVVSVVDITNKQEDVRRVQTLAGL